MQYKRTYCWLCWITAIPLALMLMAGSALVLVGMLWMYFISDVNGAHSFDLLALSQQQIPIEAQRYIFPLLFVGFGVFTALFPFHTWVPDGHSSAPTAAKAAELYVVFPGCSSGAGLFVYLFMELKN